MIFSLFPRFLFERTGVAALAILLLGNLAACGLLREPVATPRPTPVLSVTADQVAQAMSADEFYSTYGQSTLLIRGIVSSVDPQPDHLIVGLATSGSTAVLCDLGNHPPSVNTGDTITVRSANPEQDVSREQSAVMIHNCSLP
jgi:hypothetical protein